MTFYPDLVDRGLGLVLEADGFAWHENRAALRRDCRRYTALTVAGWRVLRFSWEDVMLEPAYVQGCLEGIVRGADPRKGWSVPGQW